jgi:hypothetical protein
MFMMEIIENGEGGSRYGCQFRRCLGVAAGQGVCHHISCAWSKFDAEVKAD